ncbi:hypothetical protein BKA69DRAFT_1122504 [Paraphysoderma sedebokerense]|nr:hypothetical protein BKA69DRAFT_1122504 [Paraphysoderma sedebokerense]
MKGSYISSLRAQVAKSRPAKLAVLTSILQAILLIVFEAVVAINHSKSMNFLRNIISESDFAQGTALAVYHIIFMLAAIFQLIIMVDAVHKENSIELISVAIINFGLFVYSVMQHTLAKAYFSRFAIARDSTNSVALKRALDNFGSTEAIYIITMVVSGIFALLFLYQGYKLHKDFGWSIYKRIGADIGMRDMYKVYFVLMMLLKLDVFFYASFSLQFLIILLLQDKGQITMDVVVHIILSLTMIIILIILAVRAVKHENTVLIALFLLGTVGCLAYLGVKLNQAQIERRFDSVRNSVSLSIGICLLLGFVTFIAASLCWRNFGKGLKPHLSRSTQRKQASDDSSEAFQHHLDNVGYNPSPYEKRWSLE